MNHNGVALPFMVIDYRNSNSESQFPGQQHTNGFCMAGAVKEDRDFNWFCFILSSLRMLVILKFHDKILL